MGLNLNMTIPILTVFLQGLISFFSPCVLPILPLYISYFSGNSTTLDENGNIVYPKLKIFINTLFFVFGISITFFILGFGFTTFGKFFSGNQALFTRISGIIMVLFGLYQLGFLGKGKLVEKEKRFNLNLEKFGSNPITALLLGFTFSFAWTPCIGPIMSSVLLMASTSATASRGFLLIAVYVLGFSIPFLITGLFSASVLNFFKKNRSIVKYTIKIGAILMILMGFMTFTGAMNGISSYLSSFSFKNKATVSENVNKEAEEKIQEPENENIETEKENEEKSEEETTNDKSSNSNLTPAIDFSLVDQYGNTHTLSEYKGKTVFLNFWATWCPPCRAELPHIQKVYEEYGKNSDDVVILGVVAPKLGAEQNIDGIKNFLDNHSLNFPVLMDEGTIAFSSYMIRSFPTTFMINSNGEIFGYVSGSLSEEIIKDIIEQTKNSTNTN